MTKIIDNTLLDKVSGEAKESPRLRMNYNFHTSLNAKAQCLLNAVEPGTKVVVHRHLHADETFIVLRGRLKVLIYNNDKSIQVKEEINPLRGVYGYNIPKGVWHTIEVLEPNTVLMEVKDGPYIPISPDNILEVV